MIAAIVLAAGGSSRLGAPKQLLQFRGKTLVGRAVAAAAGAGCEPVVVVLGASAGAVGEALRGEPVITVVNERWRDGVASSIRAGVERVREVANDVLGVVLLTCDQPWLTDEVVRGVLRAYDGSPEYRVASEYAGTLGVPALFGRAVFPSLERLVGDRGAKSLLYERPGRTARVPWPRGAIEVNSAEDYQALPAAGDAS